MTLNSFEYLLFLPIVFILYWFVGGTSKNRQNIIILAASLVFYAMWDWKYLALILLVAFSTYFLSIVIQNEKGANRRKCVFVVGILLNMGILFYFKYFDFFVQSFSDLLKLAGINTSHSSLHIILPVGISFYIFSALSYLIDVFQEKVQPTRDLLAYLAYVTFFPSLLSGPISRAQKQLPQFFSARSFQYGDGVQACENILWGLVLKMCLADRICPYVDTIYSDIPAHNGTTLLITSILFTIQIYADFAGYSLIAIGSGKLLGIDLPTNFARPYLAKTVTDFWRRWHISLTTWFRDYIYFPLGGNRVSKPRWIFNTMTVFIVSGIWHGAAYTFLIWGFAHGLFMVTERLIYGKRIKEIPDKITILNISRAIVTFAIVSFAWIFFKADSIENAFLIITKIFTDFGIPSIDRSVFFAALPVIIIVMVKDLIDEFRPEWAIRNHKSKVVKWSAAIALVLILLVFGVFETGSFIYVQF